jgi:hypothetical protein
MILGYARVSTDGQTLDAQLSAIFVIKWGHISQSQSLVRLVRGRVSQPSTSRRDRRQLSNKYRLHLGPGSPGSPPTHFEPAAGPAAMLGSYTVHPPAPAFLSARRAPGRLRPSRCLQKPSQKYWRFTSGNRASILGTMCGRVVQSSGPPRYAIVHGLNVRDSRVSNYPPR